jgi:glycosyltransferase involved in cell wall biosynthesis
MKVSVITVAYNSEKTIRGTIESVLNQDYPDLEYIIIDGESKDGTPDIVRSYGSGITRFVSEKDSGIYNAMNKGLSYATGEIVGFLNSDDLYAHSSVIRGIVRCFTEKSVDSVHTDLVYVKQDDVTAVVRTWRSVAFRPGMFATGIFPPHPTFYVKKKIYDVYGGFDETYRVAADFDLMLRFLEVHRVTNAYLSEVSVRMRAGGASNGSLRQISSGLRESFDSFKRHGVRGRFGFIPKTLLRRFLQLFPGKSR